MTTLDRLLVALGGAAGVAAAVAGPPAAAFEALRGCFVAERACPATPAIRRDDNPGGAVLEGGQGYELLGKNRAEATHFRVRLPEAEPRDRWVEAACGRATAEACGGGVAGPGAGGPGGASHADNLLAVNWQPAFCEGHGDKPECASQTEARFDASHLALHGLWPQPRAKAYCDGVSDEEERLDKAGEWGRLAALQLTAGTRDALAEVMPGTRSFLDRHEWVKHGTCYSASAEEYYAESVRLMRELNGGPVRELFAGSVGRTVTLEQVRDAFDRAFGAGAGERVAMECDRDGDRRLIVELKINLVGEVTDTTRLADLLAAARPAPEGCPSGEVDRAGLQ